jgi:hypothetical protein
MTVGISGNTWHIHGPCERCGYEPRFRRPELTDPAWQEEIRQAKQRVAEWERSQETQ